MKIIAYTYEADVHCPTCTTQAWRRGAFGREGDIDGLDEHGLPYSLIDREGNPIHPVFDIDEDPDGTFTHCGDCHEELQ